MGHQSRICIEIREVDGNLDRLPQFVVAEPIPEVLEAKPAVAFREARVENQLKGEEQVAFTDLVLTNNDDVSSSCNLEVSEISEVAYPDPTNSHASSPSAPERLLTIGCVNSPARLMVPRDWMGAGKAEVPMLGRIWLGKARLVAVASLLGHFDWWVRRQHRDVSISTYAGGERQTDPQTSS
ncbi:hypothetical protein [Methylobacterium fujisawaense]|uniref:hypothetical protein n=1 Tax=Methylobacterium fujisawaense TaxID=107400 RepID=UPI001FE66D71|nr:hypothetical protein [Methylobacterium fujisawaense]